MLAVLFILNDLLKHFDIFFPLSPSGSNNAYPRNLCQFTVIDRGPHTLRLRQENSQAFIGHVAREARRRKAVTASTAASKPVNEVPNGAHLAWLVVLGAWRISFCSFGWIRSQVILLLETAGTNRLLCLGIGTFQGCYESNPLKATLN
jgi:hypothetical protein